MLTEAKIRQFAHDWIAAWNSHSLEGVMTHYAAEVTLISPAAATILKDESGTVAGREALYAYFKRGLEVYPDLKFELLDVMCGISSVVLYYINQKGTRTGEYMEFDSNGRVIKVVSNYSTEKDKQDSA
ncbi:MAG TPA: nuclear transport factor 2 family protein [Pseudacidobacterium sp.]|jgi:ketosteroid isomerase-like protein|nr:nuclear transport factor 2 family protein [Pseudacidobacterium sp.]